MRLVKALTLIGVVIIISSCAKPSVKYAAYTQGAPRAEVDKYSDSYMLAKTQLTFDITEEPKKAPPPGQSKEAEALTEESEGEEPAEKTATYSAAVTLRLVNDPTQSFAITPWNRWYGVKTRVSLVKLENTQIIKSAKITVEDKRIEYATAIFKLLGSIANLAITPGAPAPFNPVVDTLEKMNKQGCERKACEVELLNSTSPAIYAVISVAEVPPDAIKTTEVIKGHNLDKASSVLFSAACRQATLVVKNLSDPGKPDLIRHITISDPRYVQLIGLPDKGEIVAHSECGYSVTPADVVLQNDYEVAQKYISELDGLRDLIRSLRDNSGDSAPPK